MLMTSDPLMLLDSHQCLWAAGCGRPPGAAHWPVQPPECVQHPVDVCDSGLLPWRLTPGCCCRLCTACAGGRFSTPTFEPPALQSRLYAHRPQAAAIACTQPSAVPRPECVRGMHKAAAHCMHSHIQVCCAGVQPPVIVQCAVGLRQSEAPPWRGPAGRLCCPCSQVCGAVHSSGTAVTCFCC